MKDTAFYEPDEKVFRVAHARMNSELQRQETGRLATRPLFPAAAPL